MKTGVAGEDDGGHRGGGCQMEGDSQEQESGKYYQDTETETS